MATRLIQIVTFTNVGPGATVPLPHQINLNGVPQAPDFVAADTGGFNIAVTATQVSVTNNNGAPASVNIWLELKHSISRELGTEFGDPFASLSPRPFIVAGGGISASALGGGAYPTHKVAYYRDDFIRSSGVTQLGTLGSTGFNLADGNFNGNETVVGQLEVFANNAESEISLVIGGDASAGEFPLTLGHGKFTVEWRVLVDTVPAPGSDVHYNFGATDRPLPGPGNPGHGMWFGCGQALFGNHNWWVGVTPTGGFVDTGIPVIAETEHRFTAIHDPTLATPSAQFFIDGVLRATITGADVNALVGVVAVPYIDIYNVDNINTEAFPDYIEMTYEVDRS